MVCFNRPLAEKLEAVAPAAATVTTFHGLLDRFLQARGRKLDFEGANAPGFWDGVAEQVIAEEVDEAWRFDALIVDEGQDFDAEWFGILRLFLREGADMLWLEDESQAIRYGLGPRDALDAALAREGFIGYRTRANYRSPQSIAEAIAARLPDMPFEAMNPLPGLGVGHHRAAAAEQGRTRGRDRVGPAEGRLRAGRRGGAVTQGASARPRWRGKRRPAPSRSGAPPAPTTSSATRCSPRGRSCSTPSTASRASRRPPWC